jgi:hypothetical protein
MALWECQCPNIQLDDWRDREVALAGHFFLSAPTPLLLHVPRQLYRDIEALEGRIQLERYRPSGAPLVLHRDGWFSGEVLISIDPQPNPAPDAVSFPNLFYSRVASKPGFDAALRDMPGFYKDLRAAAVGPIEAVYFWYLNCPRCLIERGAGQIVLLARSARLLAGDPCPIMASSPTPSVRVLPCGVS